MTIPERIYSPGYHCEHCDCPSECDIGGCVYENEEIEEASRKEREAEASGHNS